MKKEKIFSMLCICILLLYAFPAIADDEPGYGGDGFDEFDPLEAPIDNTAWTVITVVLAIALFFVIRRKSKWIDSL